MVTFKLAPHSADPRTQIVEIWESGEFIGAIYPTEVGVKLVSKYLVSDPEGAIEIERDKLPPIPAILINIRRGSR